MRLLTVTALLGIMVGIAMPQGIGDNTDLAVTAHWQRATVNGIDVFDHRGLIAGTDVDDDGLLEVWASIYSNGGGVAGFEMIDDSTLECIFVDTTGSAYSTGTRWVQVGDLDNDGAKEVIFFGGRDATDPVAGLYIYEATGDNTFADPVFFAHNSLGFVFNGVADNLNQLKVEHFLVDDVDGDNIEELIFATNGSSFKTDYIDTVYSETDTTYDTYGHSEDFFAVLSADGDLQSGFGTITPEFVTSARDIDMGTVDTSSADFGRENALGGGSAINVQVADTDGDGLKELILHSWNYFNTTIVEATAADTYSFGDTTYVRFTYPSDHVCLKYGAVADVDGDGKDEVYLPNYYTGGMYQIGDADGDATHFTEDEMTAVLVDTAQVDIWGETVSLNALFGAVSGDIDQDGNVDIYVATSTGYAGYDVVDLEYEGGVWTPYALVSDSLANLIVDSGDPPISMSIAVADLDGDTREELIVSYQGTMGDSVTVITPGDTSTVVHPRPWWNIRVVEWGASIPVSIRNMRVITPVDFKLSSPYPNPFNPTTTVDYILPIKKEISLIIYNLLGKEVVRLVDQKEIKAGSHQVVWNGRDANGIEVASGNYIIVLKYDNFTKSRRVTFLK
jgi:hypothetical protein